MSKFFSRLDRAGRPDLDGSPFSHVFCCLAPPLRSGHYRGAQRLFTVTILASVTLHGNFRPGDYMFVGVFGVHSLHNRVYYTPKQAR